MKHRLIQFRVVFHLEKVSVESAITYQLKKNQLLIAWKKFQWHFDIVF